MSDGIGVLVLLVATNGAEWLPEVIKGVKAQDHRPLDVIAVDNASTDGSRASLVKAFGAKRVVQLERRVGHGRALAAALKIAVERGTKAGAFLILHDDAALDPGSVSAMVDVLTGDRVGVVGSKVVEWDDPQMLQEVGLSVDRYGRVFNPLERGELDQGQHDRSREVMWATSSCLLVARETVEQAGFLDLRYTALRDDLDLCWRARLAGFRVVYCAGARVRHAAASVRGRRAGPVPRQIRYFGERNLLASLIKNYSARRLVTVLPVAVALAVVNAVLFLFTGRRREALQVVEALQWNALHLPGTIRGRRRAQRARAVTDSEVMRFMVSGAPRVRSYVERALESVVGDPTVGLEEAEGMSLDEPRRRRLREVMRAHPAATIALAIWVAYLIGARGLLASGPLAGADMPPFPHGPAGFFREFFSGWRSGGLGAAEPATPALLLAGVLSILTFGSTWLAQRLLIVALVPLGAMSASRLASALGLEGNPRRYAALVYAASPFALSALGEGRLAELVLLAAAPALCVPLVRAAGLAKATGRRSVVLSGFGLAVTASFSPWALVFVIGAGALLAAGALAAGMRMGARRVAATAGAMSVIAAGLLLPWSIQIFRSGGPLGIGGGSFGAGMLELVGLLPGLYRPVPLVLALAFPVAAVAGFAVAGSDRRPAAITFAVAGTGALAAAWAVSRGVGWIAPRPALPLSLVAVTVAMLAGFGSEGISATLRARAFGLHQVVLGAVAGLALVALGSGVAWFARGDRPGLVDAARLAPSFLASERSRLGDFRVLWLDGDARRISYALTDSDGDTMATYGQRVTGAGRRVLDRVLSGVASGRADAAGKQLAAFGIRYVIVRSGSAASLADALDRQVDLRFVQRFRGSSLFLNDSWLTIGMTVATPGWDAASEATSERAPAAIAAAEPDPLRGRGYAVTAPGVLDGVSPFDAKGLLLAMTYHRSWRLVPLSGPTRRGTRSFGWATAFGAPAGGSARIVWTGQRTHALALAGEAFLLMMAAILVSRQAARDRGER
jgi:GT2 family glycosyltransferase